MGQKRESERARRRWVPQEAYAPVLKSTVKSMATSFPSEVAPARQKIFDGWRLVVERIDSGRE